MLDDRRDVAARILAAGIHLPVAPAAVGAYRPVVIRNHLGFVSGQFPYRDRRLAMRGRIGVELSPQEGREAAEIAAVNVLAQIELALEDWRRFGGLLRVDGYVASAADFENQPAVLDGASELFVRALGGELGAHARTAFHVARLPLDAPVELAVTFALSHDI